MLNRKLIQAHSSCAFILALAACAAPGQPSMITPTEASAVGEIDGCQNVSPANAVSDFDTKYYLTTWGSAFLEGASAGVQEALEEKSGPGSIIIGFLTPTPSAYQDTTITAASLPPDPYCMTIDKPASIVERSLQQTFANLAEYGYDYRLLARDPLVVTTNLVSRSHRAARWLDRYTAYASPISSERTALVIFREVYISRDESGYYQGYSVGKNEAWIMARVRDATDT